MLGEVVGIPTGVEIEVAFVADVVADVPFFVVGLQLRPVLTLNNQQESNHHKTVSETFLAPASVSSSWRGMDLFLSTIVYNT